MGMCSVSQAAAGGWIEFASPQVVKGWACDTEHPNDNVKVEVWRDNNAILLGSGTANLTRDAGVARACGGTRINLGFSINLQTPAYLNDGAFHELRVYGIGRDGVARQLPNSPVIVKYPGGIEGWIEYADSMVVIGWACNTAIPNNVIAVSARWDSDVYPINTAAADIPRESAVATVCGGSSSIHGFRLSIDKHIQDGKTHQLHVYVAGLDRALPNSPIAVRFPIPPAPAREGDIVARNLNSSGAGWAGHIGIWDGVNVVEVLNKVPSVQENSWQSFVEASWLNDNTGPWKTLSPAYGNRNIWGCFPTTRPDCDNYYGLNQYGGYEFISRGTVQKGNVSWAVVSRAKQIGRIGSDFTSTVAVKIAVPATIQHHAAYGIRSYPPQRGQYRCDTFIKDALSAATNVIFYENNYYFYGIDRSADATPHLVRTLADPYDYNWDNKIKTVVRSILTTPSAVYNDIAAVLK